MGLFDKKYCDVCGNKIGLLGNRKLVDGNLCKDCAKKLSPWFTERKQSTVEEIKEQLKYREGNQLVAERFQPTITLGESTKLMIDTNKKVFTVTYGDPVGENADIVGFDFLTGVDTNIEEYKREIYYKDKEGKRQSYNPPRYEYEDDFYVIIHVDTPYFDEMKIHVNPNSVTISENSGRGILGRTRFDQYDHYKDLMEEMKKTLLEAASGKTETPADPPVASETPVAETPVSAEWTCSYCGTTGNTGKFCTGCGAKRE